MKKALFGVAGVLMAATMAVPAGASVIICSGTGQQCAPQTDDNFLLISAEDVAVVNGTFNGGGQTIAGTFTSMSGNLDADANGQAVVSTADGTVLNDLTFSLTGGTFGVATFNLSAAGQALPGEATSVIITSIGLGGVETSQTFSLDLTGSNFFGIYGTQGERFTGFEFVGNPATTGITDFRQLRLGDVQAIPAVPEPGTWAMMLIGFGGMGVALRRRRKLTNIAQLA